MARCLFRLRTREREEDRRAAGAWRGCDITRYTSQTDTGINAIDPCVKTDDNGDMWMTFGSWFGGMWMFKLDSATGLRDYNSTYPPKRTSPTPTMA